MIPRHRHPRYHSQGQELTEVLRERGKARSGDLRERLVLNDGEREEVRLRRAADKRVDAEYPHAGVR